MFEVILIIAVAIGGYLLYLSFRQKPRPEGCICTGVYNAWCMSPSPDCPIHKHHLEADILYEHAELESLKK